MAVMDMKKYYDFRKEVHKLYSNDTCNLGDLSCKVLEVRDRYRCIDSINISIQDYSIDVELDQGTSDKKKLEIAHKVADCIGRYIVDNRNALDPEIISDNDFNELFLASGNSIFCDVILVGDSIKFNL